MTTMRYILTYKDLCHCVRTGAGLFSDCFRTGLCTTCCTTLGHLLPAVWICGRAHATKPVGCMAEGHTDVRPISTDADV